MGGAPGAGLMEVYGMMAPVNVSCFWLFYLTLHKKYMRFIVHNFFSETLASYEIMW